MPCNRLEFPTKRWRLQDLHGRRVVKDNLSAVLVQRQKETSCEFFSFQEFERERERALALGLRCSTSSEEERPVAGSFLNRLVRV